MPDTAVYLKRYFPPGALAAVFLLVVAYVNPIREVALWDDWAYNEMVHTALATGTYRPHPFLAPNPILQISWAVLLSNIFGYSFSITRISTLTFHLVGILSVYGLAREHEMPRRSAFLIALAFLSSTAIMTYAFTFNTDVPYTAMVTASLFLYTRALRLRSLRWMVAGSLAAAGTILIRQHGVFLVASLGLLWLQESRRKESLLLYLCGLTAPLVAMSIQSYVAAIYPTWATTVVIVQERAYLGNLGQFLPQLVWRPVLAMEYLVVDCLPLSILMVAYLGKELSALRGKPLMDRSVRFNFFLIVAFALTVAFAHLLAMLVLNDSVVLPVVFAPLPFLVRWPPVYTVALDLFSVIGAFALVRAVILRLGDTRSRPFNHRLVDIAAFLNIVLVIIYYMFQHRYFFPLAPYVLLVVGLHLGKWLEQNYTAAALLTVIMLVITGLWVRGVLTGRELEWKIANALRESGVPVDKIYTSYEWMATNGEFDRYLANGGLDDYDQFETFFNVWLPERLDRSRILLMLLSEIPRTERWQLVQTVPDHEIPFLGQKVYIFVRIR